jgi:hypothetical protein
VQIFTSDPEYPELRVPVTVVKELRAAVRATPSEVNLTAGAGARVVLLRGAEGEEVEVAGVDCEDPAIRCTRAKGPGNMATLRLQVDSSKVPADGLHTSVRVRFARPADVSIDVPVHCSPN